MKQSFHDMSTAALIKQLKRCRKRQNKSPLRDSYSRMLSSGQVSTRQEMS